MVDSLKRPCSAFGLERNIALSIASPRQPRSLKPTPTVESLKELVAKLAREVEQVRIQATALNQRLGDFKKKHPITRRSRNIPRFDWRVRAETDEPRRSVDEAIWNLEVTVDLDPATRALFALLKDADGALRDIRAARNDIDAISNDADLRGEWLKWSGR